MTKKKISKTDDEVVGDEIELDEALDAEEDDDEEEKPKKGKTFGDPIAEVSFD